MQKKYIKFLICLLAFLLAGMFFGMNGLEKEEAQWETMQVKDTVLDNTLLETVSIQETVNNIYVHICGEVIKPGVWYMNYLHWQAAQQQMVSQMQLIWQMS